MSQSMVTTEPNRLLLSPENVKRSQSTISHASPRSSTVLNRHEIKAGRRQTMLRPNIEQLKQRLSGVFSMPEVPRVKIASPDPLMHSPMGAARADYSSWRPIPFALNDEGKDIYLCRNEHGLVDIKDSDKVTTLYETNLPALSTKPAKHLMPVELRLTSTAAEKSTRAACSTTTIVKNGSDLVVHIQGLEPITFYRARPDCIIPVDCFTARQLPRPQIRVPSDTEPGQTTLVTPPSQTIGYAWKNTSMVGKGGLKLVDMRDNEILAYWEPLQMMGKYFGKLRLQGSGLSMMRLVVSTILALKYRPMMRDSSGIDEEAMSSTTGSKGRAPPAIHVSPAEGEQQEDTGTVI